MNISRFKPSGRAVFAALLLAAFILMFMAASAQSTRAATTNLVVNGSFEKDNDHNGIPDSWFRTGSGILPKRVCNQSYAGTCSVKFVGDTLSKSIYQYFNVPGPAGDDFTMSLRAKSKSIVIGPGIYRINMEIGHTDENSSDTVNFLLDPGTTNWSLYQVSLEATEAYNYVRVAIDFDPDSGKAWFDKVKLVGP